MTRRPLRIALAVPLLAIGLGTASAAARGGPAAPLCAQAASIYRAGVVVEHGDGQVVRRCVGFDTSTITALALLEASGIEYAVASYGGLGDAVCQIDNEPAHYTQCLPGSGSFWVFFMSRGGGAWTNSPQGLSNATVRDGDDVGFRYDPLGGADPPPVSPAGTCATSTPTPTPTAAPTPPSTPKPTAVPTSPPGGSANPATPGRATTRPSQATSAGAAPGVTQSPGATAGVGSEPSPPTASVPVADTPVASVSGPFTPGLLLAAGVVAALVALLGVQGLRRRR